MRFWCFVITSRNLDNIFYDAWIKLHRFLATKQPPSLIQVSNFKKFIRLGKGFLLVLRRPLRWIHDLNFALLSTEIINFSDFEGFWHHPTFSAKNRLLNKSPSMKYCDKIYDCMIGIFLHKNYWLLRRNTYIFQNV